MIYLLFYDTDSGSREEWNTFYTPVEAFSSKELRSLRVKELKNAVDDDGDPYDYQFHTIDVKLDETSS